MNMENMENNNGQSYRRSRTLNYLAITLDGYWASMIERELLIEQESAWHTSVEEPITRLFSRKFLHTFKNPIR